MYLYRAINSDGNSVEFWFSKERAQHAAKRLTRKALIRHALALFLEMGYSAPTERCKKVGTVTYKSAISSLIKTVSIGATGGHSNRLYILPSVLRFRR